MKLSKQQPKKPAEPAAQALHLAGAVTSSQRQFLRVAASQGKALEPAGLLAGTAS